jgi:putative SOS response-associated peptidase YedK
VRIDPRDGEREVAMARWGLIPFWNEREGKIGTRIGTRRLVTGGHQSGCEGMTLPGLPEKT